jgi:hypothetical protein
MARFLIDSDEATPQPNDMRHPGMPIVGTTLAGAPVHQGFPGLEVSYQVLSYEKIKKLFDLYDPTSPGVTVTFDEPRTGARARYDAVMHEPEVGGRTTLLYLNVVVRFTHLANRATV